MPEFIVILRRTEPGEQGEAALACVERTFGVTREHDSVVRCLVGSQADVDEARAFVATRLDQCGCPDWRPSLRIE